MIWRNSLPARVALATTALLFLVMLLTIGVAYTTTAMLLREGVDSALYAALPTQVGSMEELEEAIRHSRQEENDDDDDHGSGRFEVVDPPGVAVLGAQSPSLPVDRELLRQVLRERVLYATVTQEQGRLAVRRGPDWWVASTPRTGELRVMYALVENGSEPVVVQMAAPLEMVGEVLSGLVVRLALMGAVGTLLAGLIAWRMSAQTYRPLRAIIATADDISAQTPSLRIPNLWPDQTMRRLVAVLNAMIARLQEAFEAQGRFVAAAAHELRGPLAAMRAELEVALRRERNPQEYRAALEGALVETSRLSALSEHLLTLARYERGAGLAMEQGVDLTALLHSAAREVMRSTGGEVRVDSPPGLLVNGDPISLERMVSNLARNGVQAGGSPVAVRARADEKGVTIAVEDRGHGIAPGDLPHLFEPFYRADPARGRSGGTGLGLAIVKIVVEAHGGQVSVESQPGQGSTFRVWLPRRI
ncbi:MAG: sensor histidine kinase [Bacillota bacterium]